MQSAVAACSAALIALGAQPIQSLDDTSTEGDVARALYPPTMAAILAAHPWTFGTRFSRLQTTTRASTTVSPLYPKAWAVPVTPDQIARISGVWDGDPVDLRLLPFERQTGIILTAECVFSCTLEWVGMVDVEDWPADVYRALISRLKAEFCVAITQTASAVDGLFSVADDDLRKARNADSQQHATPVLARPSLLSLRRI